MSNGGPGMTAPAAAPIRSVPASGFRGLAGVATRDVTPPVGIRNRNWGPATHDTAAGVHRPFSLTALALASSDRSELVLVLALDGTWWRQVSDWRAIQLAITEALDLSEEQLLLNLSHTHAGASLGVAEQDLAGGELIAGYLDILRQAAVDAGRAAIETLEPATVEWAAGHCDVAVNRELDLDGRALVGYNPTGSADDTVLVGRVSRSDRSALATVVNYACHPTTLAWQNRNLSPDYVGALRETVENATGAPCLFLQGASGDLAPREQYTGDVAVADRHGRAIGHAALAALETMPPPQMQLELVDVVESGAPLAVWAAQPAHLSDTLRVSRTVTALPLRPLPTLAELEAGWVDIDPRSRTERLRRARHMREGYLDLERRPDSVDHPIWSVRIGDAYLVAHPGEAYCWFQSELRRRFPDNPIVVANLTNGPGFVYLPDGQAYRRNAYQSWQTPLAEGSLELLAEAAVRAVEALG
jgi:hypothetical protein